ncbi:MAG: cytochrome c biogenesis CcdA family protein [Burkholderiaceae bacterium]|nr:cytochrome c biogenesis CcdA family protein [Burkholderiaceae bacterium]
MVTWSELGLSLAAGSLTTLSPCVFPLLPLVLGGALQGHRAAPVAMGFGMASSFALIGLLVGTLGDAIGLTGDGVRSAGGALLFVFGLVMLVPALEARFSHWMSPLASSAQAAGSRLNTASLGGALALGGLLGLVWSPCSGPLLGSALALVATEGGAGRGALILGLFGVGAAVPLVAAAYASRAGFGQARGWVIGRAARVKRIFGIVLLALGLAIVSGFDKRIEARFNDWLPQSWLYWATRF